MQETELSAEELELQAAQQRLNQAAANVAKLRQAALDKAAAELAAYKAAEEKKLADQRAEALAIEQAHLERKRKQEEDAKVEAAGKKAEEDRLAAEVAKREEEQRVANAKAAEVKRIQDAARALEIEQQQLEQSLRQSTVLPVEEKPQTLSTHVTPLANIFGRPVSNEVSIREISAEEHAKMQRQAETQTAKVLPARRTQRFTDQSISREVEDLLRKELKINPNPQRCDALSAEWHYDPLMQAVRCVIAACKERPLGHDHIFSLIESTLEAL